jgi:hypothetical protein
MRARLCFCAVIVMVVAARTDPVRGDSDEKATKIAGHIKQLGDDEFSQREAASAALETIREPALDAVRRVAASSKDAEVRWRATSILEAAGLPNIKLASTFTPQAADFEFLHNIKGQSRKAILLRLGHPHEAEWHADGVERWTYTRTDGKLFWIFFRNGIATIGMPTDGLQIGGQEFKY